MEILKESTSESYLVTLHPLPIYFIRFITCKDEENDLFKASSTKEFWSETSELTTKKACKNLANTTNSSVDTD